MIQLFPQELRKAWRLMTPVSEMRTLTLKGVKETAGLKIQPPLRKYPCCSRSHVVAHYTKSEEKELSYDWGELVSEKPVARECKSNSTGISKGETSHLQLKCQAASRQENLGAHWGRVTSLC